MPQPFDYTIKNEGPALSFARGIRFGQEIKQNKQSIKENDITLESKQEALAILKDKNKLLRNYGDVAQFAHLPYQERQKALQEYIIEQENAGRDMTATKKFLNLNPSDQLLAFQGMTQYLQSRGWLESPGPAPRDKVYKAYDIKTGKNVYVPESELLANRDRYEVDRPFSNTSAGAKSSKQSENDLPIGPLKEGGLPEDTTIEEPKIWTPFKNDLGETYDLGKPREIKNRIQLKAREKEGEELLKKANERQETIQQTDMLVNDTAEALKQFEQYSNTSTGGTGWIVTFGGRTKAISEPTEKLHKTFMKIRLNTVKEFAKEAGARAIDSDAEREALDITVPSITADDEANRTLLVASLAAGVKRDRYLKEKEAYIQKWNTLDGFKSSIYNSVVLFDPNKPVGTKPIIVPKKEAKEYKKRGFVTTDRYLNLLNKGKVPLGPSPDDNVEALDQRAADVFGS